MTDTALFAVGLLIFAVTLLATVSGLRSQHRRMDEARNDARNVADLVNRRQAYLAAGLKPKQGSKVNLPLHRPGSRAGEADGSGRNAPVLAYAEDPRQRATR